MRADAARNRDRLLAAAVAEFQVGGLDAPLEGIARRAGVSIGTLYNHFPTRDALVDAIVPERMAALDRIAAASLAEGDPWRGFTVLVEGLLAMQLEDRGVNDALVRRHALSPVVRDACARGFRHADRILARARAAGRLRPDFTPDDLFTVVRMLAHAVRDSDGTPPDEVRRCLGFLLDGLRA